MEAKNTQKTSQNMNNTPLKTNNRWRRNESEGFSNNRFISRDRGGYRGGRRGERREYGGHGGRRSGRGNGRRGRYNNFKRSMPPKSKTFALPEGYKLETEFPILGKPTNNANNTLNWRTAAEKGASAPPPPIFIKHETKPKTVEKEINLDDYDEEEYDSAFYQSDDDMFPAKGGYID